MVDVWLLVALSKAPFLRNCHLINYSELAKDTRAMFNCKRAKTVVAAKELDGLAGPAPCQPLMLRDSSASVDAGAQRLSWRKLVRTCIHNWTLTRTFLLVTLIVTMVVLFKPSLATAVTKILVRLPRLTLGRITGFLVLLMEGLLNEVLYQIEYALRQVLPHPIDFEQFASAPFQMLPHVISTILGAFFPSIATYISNRNRYINIPTID